MAGLRSKLFPVFWAMSLLVACGGEPGPGNGQLKIASVVAPLYGGVEVSYVAVQAGSACDASAVGQVKGPASVGEYGALSRPPGSLARASELLTLQAGSYWICASVRNASGTVEERCPTAVAEVEVHEGRLASLYMGVVCDPVIDPRSGHAYTVTPLLDTFLDTKAAAEQMGGHLVYIDDAEENLMLGRYFGPHKWIGMWDERGDGSFTWLDGKPRPYSNFCVGEPNLLHGEYYVEWGLMGADSQYCWNNEVIWVRQGIVEFE